jgi:DnaJ like chaperone protein
MPIIYQRQGQGPGCGGCLLLFFLLLLLGGGAPLVYNVIGVLFFGFLFFLLLTIGAILLFSYYIRRQVGLYEKSQTEMHNSFVFLLVHILVKVAQIDGQVTKEETDIITSFFRTNLRYKQTQMYWVKDIIKQALGSTIPLETLLLEFRNKFAYEPRLILVELVYQVLFTKRHVPAEELEIARRIAEMLGISQYEQQAIFGKYQARARQQGSVEESYYEILGLQPGADFAEIKKAYRTLSMQYHPDKVAHLGDEFKRVAEEKMKEINEAYQYLKTKFNA